MSVAFIVSSSKNTFIAFIAVCFVFIVVLFVGGLPNEVLNVFVYLLVLSFFLTAIILIVYKHSKNKQKKEQNIENSQTRYAKDGEEPRIGQTYSYKHDDE